MTRHTPHLIIAAVLAVSNAAAFAQAPTAPAPPAAGETVTPRAGHHSLRDPAQMQQRRAEHHTQRMAELKSALNITPAQEGAWTQFVAASQPPTHDQHPSRADTDKLTTPQRIDQMQQRTAERQAQMKQRGDAVKTFYAQLTPEQQKTFDSRPLRGEHGQGKHGQRHRGG